VLSVLRQRAEHGEVGLSNAEIRQVTRLDRYQVVRLVNYPTLKGGACCRGPLRGTELQFNVCEG